MPIRSVVAATRRCSSRDSFSPHHLVLAIGFCLLAAAGCATTHPDIALKRGSLVRVSRIGCAVHVSGEGQAVSVHMTDDVGCISDIGLACCMGVALGAVGAPYVATPTPNIEREAAAKKEEQVQSAIVSGGWSCHAELREAVRGQLVGTRGAYEILDYEDSIPVSLRKRVVLSKPGDDGGDGSVDFETSEAGRRVDALLILEVVSQSVERPNFGSVGATATLRGVLVKHDDYSRPLWRKTVTGSSPLNAQFEECLASNGLLLRAGLKRSIKDAVEKLRQDLRVD